MIDAKVSVENLETLEFVILPMEEINKVWRKIFENLRKDLSSSGNANCWAVSQWSRLNDLNLYSLTRELVVGVWFSCPTVFGTVS